MHTGSALFLGGCTLFFCWLFVWFPLHIPSHIFSHLLWFILPLLLAMQDDSLFGPDHKIIYRLPTIFCIVPELVCSAEGQTQRTEQRSEHVSGARFRMLEMHVNALTVIYTSWLTGHRCFLKRRHELKVHHVHPTVSSFFCQTLCDVVLYLRCWQCGEWIGRSGSYTGIDQQFCDFCLLFSSERRLYNAMS